MRYPTTHVSMRMPLPLWAIQQRHLFATLEDAAVQYIDRYVLPDGTLRWRSHWPRARCFHN